MKNGLKAMDMFKVDNCSLVYSRLETSNINENFSAMLGHTLQLDE